MQGIIAEIMAYAFLLIDDDKGLPVKPIPKIRSYLASLPAEKRAEIREKDRIRQDRLRKAKKAKRQ